MLRYALFIFLCFHRVAAMYGCFDPPLSDWIFLVAAPTPPPRPLTAELLVGWHDYSWGNMAEGWIEFCDDGTYFARHYPGVWPTYTGRYTVRGDVLTLHEARMPCPESWEVPVITCDYPIRLSTARYPVLAGACHSTAVTLSRRE